MRYSNSLLRQCIALTLMNVAASMSMSAGTLFQPVQTYDSGGLVAESAYLSIAGPDDTAIYIALAEGTRAVRHTSWVGRSVARADLAKLRNPWPGAVQPSQADRPRAQTVARAACGH